MVFATGCGTPRWRSITARIDGPSLSRKNSERNRKEMPIASEVTPLIPLTIPFSSACSAFGIALDTLEFASPALDELTPALSNQLCALLAPLLAAALISEL